MLALHKTLKTFGGKIQVQPSMKKEATLLCGCFIVPATPTAATESKHIVQFRLHKKTAAPMTFHSQGASYHLK